MTRRVPIAAILAAACAASFSIHGPIAAAQESSPGPKSNVEVYKRVPDARPSDGDDERDDVELKIHLVTPAGHGEDDARPAAVFFFGGGWNSGTVEQFRPHAEYLASRGMVVALADYRVKSRHGTSPFECVADGKSAVRWLRTNADRLGIDPQRIAAGGGSAGGHVAAATGVVPGLEQEGEDARVSSRPNALLLFNPVFDNGPDGYGHARVKAHWREISPMHNIAKGAPPTIVFLGTKDNLIPVATAREYERRMKEAGSRCDVHLYEDQPHGFFNKSRNPRCYALTVREMDRFLVSLGWLKGEPTIEVPETAGGSKRKD